MSAGSSGPDATEAAIDDALAGKQLRPVLIQGPGGSLGKMVFGETFSDLAPNANPKSKD
jgi:hypothetical protein